MVGRGVLVGVGVVGGVRFWSGDVLRSPFWVALLSSKHGGRKDRTTEFVDSPRFTMKPWTMCCAMNVPILSCGTFAGRVQAKFVRTRG